MTDTLKNLTKGVQGTPKSRKTSESGKNKRNNKSSYFLTCKLLYEQFQQLKNDTNDPPKEYCREIVKRIEDFYDYVPSEYEKTEALLNANTGSMYSQFRARRHDSLSKWVEFCILNRDILKAIHFYYKIKLINLEERSAL